jgi:hypothetical protein
VVVVDDELEAILEIAYLAIEQVVVRSYSRLGEDLP